MSKMKVEERKQQQRQLNFKWKEKRSSISINFTQHDPNGTIKIVGIFKIKFKKLTFINVASFKIGKYDP